MLDKANGNVLNRKAFIHDEKAGLGFEVFFNTGDCGIVFLGLSLFKMNYQLKKEEHESRVNFFYFFFKRLMRTLPFREILDIYENQDRVFQEKHVYLPAPRPSCNTSRLHYRQTPVILSGHQARHLSLV